MGPVDFVIELLQKFMGKTRVARIVPRCENGAGDIQPTDDNFDFETRAFDAVPGDVILISGCKSEYRSSSVAVPISGGTYTQALLNAIAASDDRSWMGVLKSTRDEIEAKGLSQVPLVGTSRSTNMTTDFSFFRNSGNTKSLYVGINYVGHSHHILTGCHESCWDMMECINTLGRSTLQDTQRVLMDDGGHSMPTAQNICESMSWLVSGAKAGDNLFMHYAGHGCKKRGSNNDDDNEIEEVLVPVDYESKGYLCDDDIYDLLVSKVPKNCALTIILDCSNAETVVVLPYTMKVDETMIAEYEKYKQAEAQVKAEWAKLTLRVTEETARWKQKAIGGLGSVHGKEEETDVTLLPSPSSTTYAALWRGTEEATCCIPSPPSTLPNPSLCGVGMIARDSFRLRSQLR